MDRVIDGFIRDIYENPLDDDIRLIFADYLEDTLPLSAKYFRESVNGILRLVMRKLNNREQLPYPGGYLYDYSNSTQSETEEFLTWKKVYQFINDNGLNLTNELLFDLSDRGSNIHILAPNNIGYRQNDCVYDVVVLGQKGEPLPHFFNWLLVVSAIEGELPIYSYEILQFHGKPAGS